MKRGIHSYYLNQTIQQRFRFWIGAVIVMLGFSIIVPFYLTGKHNRLIEIESQLQQIVALQSLYIERWSQEKLETMKRFANSDHAKFHRIADLNKEIAAYSRVHSEFGSIFYVNKDGYAESGSDRSSNIYVGDRSYFTQAAKNKDHISGVVESKTTGRQMITISSPVLGE